MSRIIIGFVSILILVSGCATVSEKMEPREAPVAKVEQKIAQKKVMAPAEKVYKRKLAIIRFSNETNYGKSLLLDDDLDRIGKQTSDMLASRLIKSEKFLVFERADLNKLMLEREISGENSNLIGVDTVISGSVTEFGRSISGKSGFLSSTKVQTAKAKVDIRLIDVRTGHAFFSAIGAGEASTESGEVFGFGSRAEYDATLNDKVISAAISDVIDQLVSELEKRPWRTDILGMEDGNVFISGGKFQGLKVGDRLNVMKAGRDVASKQSGFMVSLPATKVALLEIVSFFGSSETNEGSLCRVVEGNIDRAMINDLYVSEGNQ